MSLPLMPARADAPPEVGDTVAAAETARDGRRGRSPMSAVPPVEPAVPAVPAGPTGSEAAAADAALLVRLSDRETAALDALYQRYGRPAYSLARRICADDGLAEDVVQEVFLALWRDPGKFDPGRGTVASWLMTLVHHKAVDAVRREATRRRHHPTTGEPDEGVPAAGPSAARQALGAVLGEQVRAALHRLPTEQRTALGLAYYGGYSQREVASLTGVPIGTVKSRMFAGVARLRVLLGPVLGSSADALGDLA
ncbi:RNA polymerase sigma factor [Actinomycetospora chibensis]|uniref:RNA polymerase sigma factor n=1 Tax=Actinomycetospora chibensis TaxID=663606 RepID=A0ABV9RH89_9PSEU|nr:sigma-70 family RNA polymerase sigma factor [Actinomycetospora chibensis]MDD7923957.1 sigma-70 family RNA polymerase sigma factor [Actinomycetospora chibensis]